ncbi:hypothetical protein A3I27_04500 [Candidatus Giovannonibacteria bacterium RIFCSPLOWO2_02_FULL_43_11b]|uniref:Putative membrane protein insertion efficiency factor n=1 Tax=Candidatus Giovannonibacteria bacterium RIFCSPHIGHO2_12_FULL_43_15 TaxID=1798341 RepID=A0A1F5WPG1_9BACT|nr:MAG: hypothetical protein A2739_01530 [Candidatus Giovannonibacteria bacterium RIFCSPHIGHO2_01_FULL_43_100]OGF66749.1 MAG: hypothetical protein A3B97_02440 [Candidatus Giovannonibacteria bacterium RIFCSPHIGHO2_02_FULL_43_32]OGF77525.1 MAG: hypothetical protein A3F23_00935 [Candidatus Giovannonibacteria bacterium RIFCSPHIGHO2_12_FULL_43_15]OGF78986.1 MAG: hypothetical protein A3A15_00560 [Candidatus Giovannonibacteria bacterium RIFCSPLOWO2_01_FULL_43_60]OGF89969.1 MAG: hypothetical protein A3
MKKIFVAMIYFYQNIISPDQGIFSYRRKYCVFEPSCSEYMKEAVNYGGVFYGLKKGVLRIVKCHPWQKKIIDPFKP